MGGSHQDVAAALAEAGGERAAKALATVLNTAEDGSEPGTRLHCWSFSADAELVDAGRAALKTLLEDGRARLLQALKRGDPFCSTASKHMGRRDSIPLQKLGRHRAIWLLGGTTEDTMVSNASASQ